MALQDTLSELVCKSPATRNRIDILLDKLQVNFHDDHATLIDALRDPNVRPVVLTKALRAEYGTDVVTDTSVSNWRSKNLAELTGL